MRRKVDAMADPVLQIERVHECLAALQVERQEPAPSRVATPRHACPTSFSGRPYSSIHGRTQTSGREAVGLEVVSVVAPVDEEEAVAVGRERLELVRPAEANGPHDASPVCHGEQSRPARAAGSRRAQRASPSARHPRARSGPAASATRAASHRAARGWTDSWWSVAPCGRRRTACRPPTPSRIAASRPAAPRRRRRRAGGRARRSSERAGSVSLRRPRRRSRIATVGSRRLGLTEPGGRGRRRGGEVSSCR